jgi:hypothetical protein
MRIYSSGWIIYQGPSRINGEEIVVIITMESLNDKTGNMAQVWILPADVSPSDAFLTGKDVTVCGECSLRQNKGGYCYVTIPKAPQKIWEAWKNSAYPDLTRVNDNRYYHELFAEKFIRFGAYGDPYAVPVRILEDLKKASKGSTCYTHQWKEEAASEMQTMSMSSVNSVAEYDQATASGWRTFRVIGENEPLMPGEIFCPEFTRGITCKDCLLCNGGSLKKKNIAIPVHGTFKNRFGKSGE